MNGSAHGLPVALTGRTWCRVQGPVAKGDRLVSSNQRGVARVLDVALYQPGCILGKSLEEINDDSVESIEIVVGRF